MYVPIGIMPGIVRNALAFIPMAQGSAWMRKEFTWDVLNTTFAGLPKEAITEYCEITGMNLKLGDTVFTPWMQCILLLVSGVLFMLLSSLMMSKKKVRDR
jgi:multidrug/hemolysin transport system permease protein